MVRRVLRLMYKEVKGLHQAAYVLAVFTFGSQLLALIRDRVLAHEFGAGYELDVYYTAFRIPDLLYVLFASTLSVYVLIPFVARAREEHNNDHGARQLLSEVMSLFLIAYTIIAGFIVLLAPLIVPVLFPGFADDPDLILLLRILLLQPLLLGISSLFGVVTQLGHRFVLFAISPLLYNIGIIAGILFFYPVMGLSGLAWGVVLGALMHVSVQLPFVQTSTFAFRMVTRISWMRIREILIVSLPRAFTLSLNQMVMLFLVSLASLMTVGSVSVFQFAYNLQSVPLAVIGVSYSVAAFPILAELFASKQLDQFRVHLMTALRHIIFWSVPAAALIVVLRAQMVRVILGSGDFDWADTRLTAAVLALLVLSLFAQAIILVAIRAFYAGGYTKIPFYVTLGGAAIVILSALGFLALYHEVEFFSTVLLILFRVEALHGSEVLILGLAYSLGTLIEAGVLLFLLARTFSMPCKWIISHLGRSVLAAFGGGFAAYAALNFIVGGINGETFMGIFIQGFIAGVVGVVGVVLMYALLRSRELSEIYQSFQRRLFKTEVVAETSDMM